jgi:delta1-piperideine-2-carboxylate reductase
VNSVVMSLERIHELSLRILLDNGLAEDAARVIADIVTRAEADACRSHGLYRMAGYAASLRAGRVNRAAHPQVTHPAASVLLVNGDRGFAPHAGAIARPALIETVRRSGIAAMAVVNTHHFSALWADIEALVDVGLVAWCYVVGQCSVAPHGGTRRLMGTNPIAFGWPRPEGGAYIFDFATSAAARGEVELRRNAGEQLPEGWAIDGAGNPTTDPAKALEGALLPFGGHKGTALSMMVELVAGPLIGEMTSRQVAALDIADSGPPPGGELFIVIDPAAFGHDGRSAGEHFFADANAQRTLRLPSERRHAARARSREHGVAVPDGLRRELEGLCHA